MRAVLILWNGVMYGRRSYWRAIGYGAERVDITILERGKQRITLAVQDNGNGISPANRKQIFTPFFTTRREQGGTGLSLGIVRSLLEAYQGDIELSDSDLGALFLLSFKVA